MSEQVGRKAKIYRDICEGPDELISLVPETGNWNNMDDGDDVCVITLTELATRDAAMIKAAEARGMPAKLNETEIADACMSCRHDYGLLGPVEQSGARFMCQEWYYAIRKTICEPTKAIKESHPDTTAHDADTRNAEWDMAIERSALKAEFMKQPDVADAIRALRRVEGQDDEGL